MYHKHQTAVKGDMSFMDNLLPKDVKVQHMDSYNIDGKIRFQGSFYYDFDGKYVKCNDCPLEILKLSTKYQTRICEYNGCGSPHLTWTIWFDSINLN